MAADSTAAARKRRQYERRDQGIRVLSICVKVEAKEGDDENGIGNLEEALETAHRLEAGIALDVEQIRAALEVLVADWIAIITRDRFDPVPRATHASCSDAPRPRR
jgi:hypothetical protein